MSGVAGGGVSVPAEASTRFTPAQLGPGQFYLNFSSSGFSGNPSWSVTANGSTLTSNGNTVISFVLDPGAYSYSIGGGAGYSETSSPPSPVVLSGNTTVSVSWSKVSYTLTFDQSTLPSGDSWNVIVNGNSLGPTTGGSLSVTLSAGTPYSYSVTSSNTSWAPSPQSGSGTLNSNTQITITFSLVTYSVTFDEFGLPSGMRWTVTLSTGNSLSSTTPSIVFQLPAGQYSYSVSASNKTWSAPGGGFQVTSGSLTIDVTFSRETFTVEFYRVAAGLPHGTLWSVVFNGTTGSSTNQVITFASIPNGTYRYRVEPIAGYIASPSSGWDNVSGADPNPVVITWTQVVYNVTVNEVGLGSSPPRWWVNLTSPVTTGHPGIGSPIVLTVPNGSYTYHLASLDKRWEPVPATGSFTVNGVPLNFTVTFVELNTSVTFTASGLPAGIQWWTNLTGHLSANTTGTTIGFELPNGTYTYGIQSVNRTWAAPGGNFTVVYGNPLQISVRFTNILYPLTVNESGLVPGTLWSIDVYGTTRNSTGLSILFMEPNGTYPYSVPPVPGYVARNPNGSIRVHGGPQNYTINFKPVTYGIRFNETGLPRYTEWWVNVTWSSNLTSVGSFPFTVASGGVPLANGTYLVAVSSSNKSWTPEVPSSQITVNGTAFNVSVVFILKAYSITFTATGLPAGALWTVNLAGLNASSATANVTFYVKNGTYAFSVPSYGVYVPRPRSGSVTINGTSAAVSIAFTRALFTVTFRETGLPAGGSWSVTLNGVTEQATSSTIVFYETNGTFPYVVPPAMGLPSSPSSGSVRVSATNPVVTVTFGSTGGGSGPSKYIVLLVVAILVAAAIIVGSWIISKRPRRSSGTALPPPPGAVGASAEPTPETPQMPPPSEHHSSPTRHPP